MTDKRAERVAKLQTIVDERIKEQVQVINQQAQHPAFYKKEVPRG